VHREHRDGGIAHGAVPATGAFLDRPHTVLEGRVVQLHDPGRRVWSCVQAAGQVRVHEIEAARAEPEIDRGDVH